MVAKAKEKPAPKSRPKRPKQQYIPGTEPPSIPALDDAADIYYAAMQERIKLSAEEDEAKDNLIDKMKQNGVDLYETRDGLVVSILNKSNVKVKRKKDTSEEGEKETDE